MGRGPNNDGYEFKKCGHIFAEWNILRITLKSGYVYKYCRQCSNKRTRVNRRAWRKRQPIKGRPPLGPNFPCGHPRSKENSTIARGDCSRCKTCKSLRHKQRWAEGHRSPWQKARRKYTHADCAYESDIQCNQCGYLLRYKAGKHEDECVACTRERDRFYYAQSGRYKYQARRKEQEIAHAKKQHATASDIHRGGKSELTHMAEMRQDGPP